MDRPTVWTRLRASTHGEVSASTLEAYRRASFVVVELLDRVEATRQAAREAGKTPWNLAPHEQALMVCSWNAFVHQTLGAAFLDADYREDPSTVGFVPPATSRQVMAFFAPVEGWLGHAEQAAEDPAFRVTHPLPTSLPGWSDATPRPRSHLVGMLDAMSTIREHARAAVHFLGDEEPPGEAEARQYHTIRGLFAAAEAKGRYAEDFHGMDPTEDVHHHVEPTIKSAIETLHRIGQLAAMPSLTDVPETKAPPLSSSPRLAPRRPLPGDLEFDVWCLTDARARLSLQYDAEARLAVKRLWESDPDPRATLRIADEVEVAIARGDVKRAHTDSGQAVGYYYRCPWGTVWETQRVVTIAGKRLTPLQRFVIEVSDEGVQLGRAFRRGLKLGEFRPTSDFEYGVSEK